MIDARGDKLRHKYPPAPPCQRRIFLFPQVLGEPYAIVREHHPVTCLCGVQIDIGRYREIAVAFHIVENLAHMPYVGRFLVGLVEHEIGLRARIRIEKHLFV